MPAARATLALLCLSTAAAQRLVVVYDDLFDLSASGIRQQDFHANSTFVSLAAALNLTLVYHLVQPEASPDRSVLGSAGVVGVISAGNCQLGQSVLVLGQRLKVPTLILEVLDPCQNYLTSPATTTTSSAPAPASTAASVTPTAVLPLYAASVSRRYPCLKYVATNWLMLARTPAHPVVGPSLLPPPLEPRAEYMNCAKEQLAEGLPTVVEEGTPWSVQLGRARRYLNGRQLTAATVQRPPFVNLKMVGEEIIGAKGFCIEMLNEIARKFNFTYRLVLPYDGNWGAPMENGTFNGMVGMVYRKTVDFALAGFTITQIRETVIDFTHAFYEEPTTILIPPPSEQNNFLAFLEPFSWQVWSLTLVSILVVGPVMWVLAIVGDLPVLYPHDTRRVQFSILRYTWDCAFALVGQSARTRHTEPVRMLHGVWWTFAVILIYTYTGTLIAFLTVPRLSSLINSLEELADQSDVLWTYRAKTAHETLFATAPPPSTYHKIGMLLKKRPDLLVQTDDEGLSAVLRGDTAFIKEKSWLDFAMEQDYLATRQCRMSQVNQLFFSAGFGWALQERSIFLQLFNNEILRMSQSGLFTIWRMKYWPKPNECTAGNPGAPTGPKSLQLKNFSGHFFIFGVGLGLAMLAFVVERMCLRDALREAKPSKGEGLQAFTGEDSRGQHRRHHEIHMQGPLDRVHQLRAVALKNGSPLVTVIPTPFQSHPSTPVFKLHPPPRMAEGWPVLDATTRSQHRHTHHRGVTQIQSRSPIR